MSVIELVEAILAVGGDLLVDGDCIRYRIPTRAALLLAELRVQKLDVIEHLRERERRNALAYLRQFLGKQVWSRYGSGTLLAVDDEVIVGLANGTRKYCSDPLEVVPYA
jgi:hypothetical protein